MNKLFYICKSALKNIMKFKLISFVRIMSIYICLLILSVILSLYFGANEYINGSVTFRNVQGLNLYVANSPDKDITNLPDDVDFEFHASQKRIIYDEVYLGGIGLSVISKYYDNLYNNFFYRGMGISNSNECLIGLNIARKYKMDIDDIITIGDSNFIVSGITRLPRFSQKILISDESVVEVNYPKFYFYNDNISIKAAEQSCIYSHENIYDYFTGFLNNTSLISIIITCLIVLFYTLMSIVNVYKFYNEKLIITNFIQYAVGASRKIIVLQTLVENLIISFISSVLAYVSAIFLLNPLMKLISYYLSLPLYAFGIINIFAFLLSTLLAYINVKMNNRIIREVD